MEKIFPLFDTNTGYVILAVYVSLIWILTSLYSKNYNNNNNQFLVANRELGLFQGSLSIAAAWTWAPAMFISSQQAYTNGVAGLFWFCFGNFLTLMLFGYFARQLRTAYPDGFTLGEYLRDKFSSRVQILVSTEMMLLAICAFSVNILAGSQSLQVITGIDYRISSVLMALAALSYTLRGGLKASVVTEIFKMCVFYTVWISIGMATLYLVGGIETITAGVGGRTGNGTSLWGNAFVLGVAFSFGIPTALGHFSAPWADNSFYQRIFSIQPKYILYCFLIAPCIYIIIPLLGGLLGLAVAGMHIDIPKSVVNFTNVILIGNTLPSWCSALLVFVLFSSLISLLDSQLSSFSCITGQDIPKLFGLEPNVVWSRIGMAVMVLLCIAVINIPGIDLIKLFLIYGVGRGCIWLPVMFSLVKPNTFNEQGMFWGILLAWCFGMPLYLYGQVFAGGDIWIISGALTTVFGSGVLTYGISSLTKNQTTS